MILVLIGLPSITVPFSSSSQKLIKFRHISSDSDGEKFLHSSNAAEMVVSQQSFCNSVKPYAANNCHDARCDTSPISIDTIGNNEAALLDNDYSWNTKWQFQLCINERQHFHT